MAVRMQEKAAIDDEGAWIIPLWWLVPSIAAGRLRQPSRDRSIGADRDISVTATLESSADRLQFAASCQKEFGRSIASLARFERSLPEPIPQ